jgi:hypothetical protein
MIKITKDDGGMEFEVEGDDILKVVRTLYLNKYNLRVKGSSEWGLPDWFDLGGPSGIMNEGSGCEGAQCEAKS